MIIRGSVFWRVLTAVNRCRSEADRDKGAFMSSPESRSNVDDSEFFPGRRMMPALGETNPEAEESKRVAVATTARDLVEGIMVCKEGEWIFLQVIKLWT